MVDITLKSLDSSGDRVTGPLLSFFLKIELAAPAFFVLCASLPFDTARLPPHHRNPTFSCYQHNQGLTLAVNAHGLCNIDTHYNPKKGCEQTMTVTTLIGELSQVSNALTLLGTVAGVVAGWWFFYVPRKIGAKATASLPLFWSGGTELPFVVHVTNVNTRQFKINKIGFETFGRYTNRRKSCSYELDPSR